MKHRQPDWSYLATLAFLVLALGIAAASGYALEIGGWLSFGPPHG